MSLGKKITGVSQSEAYVYCPSCKILESPFYFIPKRNCKDCTQELVKIALSEANPNIFLVLKI